MDVGVTLRDLEDGMVGPYFHSKKNRVFRTILGGKEYIVKVFRGEWKERAKIEFRILSECREKRIRAPIPVSVVEDAVVMEPVTGTSVASMFDDLFLNASGPEPPAGQVVLASGLAEWLSGFHSAFGFELARGDTILKNFIMSPSGVVGLDFEEASRADTLSDLAQLCASAMMTDPPFTGLKVTFARNIAAKYWDLCGQDQSGELDGAISSAIRHYASFRANGNLLLEHASDIENGRLKIGRLDHL